MRRPLWLAGLAADAVGFGLHAYALTAGQLAIVQPLLVTSLLFALPLGAWLDRRRVTQTELVWATVSVASLGVFLALARPSGNGVKPELGPSAAAAGVALVLVVAALVAGRRLPARRAATLGVITGLAFGATAALIKAVGQAFGHDGDAIFTSWPPYALLLIGPIGFVVESGGVPGRSLIGQPAGHHRRRSARKHHPRGPALRREAARNARRRNGRGDRVDCACLVSVQTRSRGTP